MDFGEPFELFVEEDEEELPAKATVATAVVLLTIAQKCKPWLRDSDDEVRRTLIALRGVGPWTAEMVLIFSLLRADILPLGDIGVIRAVEQLYRGGDRMSVEEVAEVAECWAPYRTAGTWYLWRHLDAEPVEY